MLNLIHSDTATATLLTRQHSRKWNSNLCMLLGFTISCDETI